MAKFKVGQWVHYKDRYTSGVGKIYDIQHDCIGFSYQVAVEPKDLKRAYFNGNTCRNYTEGSIEPWQPKIGDRVRLACDSNAGGARFGAKGEAATVVQGVVEGANPYLTVQLDGGASRLNFNPAVYLSDLEPLPANASAEAVPLKIEAGKYYRTRDGRKVGPMIPNGGYYDPQYAFRITHSFDPDRGKAWRADGSFSADKGKVDDADLIAEWVEEAPAKAIVAAQSDAIADEYGPVVKAEPKFKVGDVVYAAGDANDHVTIVTARNGRYAVYWQSHGSDPSDDVIWNDSELTLVTPPPPPSSA